MEAVLRSVLRLPGGRRLSPVVGSIEEMISVTMKTHVHDSAGTDQTRRSADNTLISLDVMLLLWRRVLT